MLHTKIVDSKKEKIVTSNAEKFLKNSKFGASIYFLGTVRNINDNKTVTGITYDSHDEMVIKSFEEIYNEADQKLNIKDKAVFIEHAKGHLKLGEISIIFPQTADQSQYSVDNAFGRANSDYEIDMTYSEDNNVTFDVEGGGSLSFYKDGANFMMTGSYVSWSDEKQDFIVTDKITPMIVTIDEAGKIPATSAEIDYIIQAYQRELDDRMIINTQKKQNFLNNQQK